MAARNRPGLSENTRKRIQSTMLVKALADHAVGKNDMSATQVRAAEILLKKTLPDLSQTTIDADVTAREVAPLTPEIAQAISSKLEDGC